MGARDHHPWPLGCLEDLNNADFQTLANPVPFGAHLFRGGQYGLGSTQVNVYLTGLNALYQTGNDLVFFFRVLLQYGTVFRLMEPLQDNLLCRLGGDAPGIVRSRLHHEYIV